MKYYVNGSELQTLKGFILCDNDFLSLISSNDDTGLITALNLFPSKLYVDPFTVMEFLRGVQLPRQRKIKEDILKTGFIELDRNQEVLKKSLEKAMELSCLYANKSKGSSASIVDLLLAARLANGNSDIYLVTGNSKDFPSFIFETVSVINIEQNDGTMRAISVIKFSKEKYDIAKSDYQAMIERNSAQ